MRVLVTNDDGVDAKGIKALALALRKVPGVQVIVVAPDREQSTTSHSLTLHRPLRVIKKSKDVYAVNGTPTDCVYMATAQIIKKPVDLIMSGINRGGNLGDDVHYSGTVSAAVEGGIMGIPAVAFSQLIHKKENYSMAAKFAIRLLRALKKNPMPQGVILNVNVPEGVKTLEYEITKTGKRDYGHMSVEKIDPRGRPYYWVGGNQYLFNDIKGSDCNAIMAGKISLTPIRVNLTCHQSMKMMRAWKV